MNNYIFSMEENNLMCVKINDQKVDFKIAELFGFDHPEMEFEDLNFLNEIHRTDMITQEMLDCAKQWFENNYDINSFKIGWE